MNSLVAAYILPLIGGINWRFGLWLPASVPDDDTMMYGEEKLDYIRRKKYRRKNRAIWLKGYIVRVFVLFAIAWVILMHLGWIQINSWWALFVWGVPYLLIAWFLNIFATGFEECCIFKLGKDKSSVSEKTAIAWVGGLVGLFAIYVLVRVLVCIF